MFENLSGKFQDVLKKLRGHGRITEGNVEGALNEVRLALLEADVNYKVVKEFVAAVREKALGAEVLASLSPDQHFVKIVHDEMTRMMGSTAQELNLARKPPVPVMLVGLQGSGKTTTCGKLALQLQKMKRRPYLVPADVYRPAAIEQLKVLGRQLEIPVFDSRSDADPVAICREAIRYAELNGYDTVLLDTAGRLHIDAPLMEELARIKAATDPGDILLVADAMTGQDAVNVAKAFHEKLHLTGVVLTKMDGDARGGAALSIRAVTGAPVKFVGTGEKAEALEPFHPDRMASRILGMG
ncbi:MAG: signal recognition particle protein, partial [Deltaproteobacteria bacterium]|nr:signal recognition particle protein [Deltaproteobacteria bacterium]